MKKKHKITLSVISLILVVLVGIFLLLPTWISTPSGTQTALSWINRSIEGTVTVSRVKLSWFGDQHIENLKWVDNEGQRILEVPMLDTRTSLFYLLLGGRSFNKTIIEEPYLHLSPNMTQKLQKKREETKAKVKKSSRSKLPTFNDALYVQNGTLVVTSNKMSPITIAQINIEKHAQADTFHLRAQTNHGSLSGSITADAIFKNKLQANLSIQNFPVVIFDEIDKSTFYTDALGPVLAAEMHIEKEGTSQLSIYGSATSANLKAYVEGVTVDDTFILSPETQFSFILTPNFFKQLLSENERKQWNMASKTEIKIFVEKGIFPMKLEKPEFNKITLQATVNVDRAEIHHQTLGSYSLNQFSGTVLAQNNLEFAYSGEIQGKEKTNFSGSISMTPDKEILFEYNYKGFPVTLLSLVSSELESNVRKVFGDQFDLTSSGTYIKDNLEAEMQINSPRSHATVNLEGDFPEIAFYVKGAAQIPKGKAKIIGNSIDIVAEGTANFTDNQLSLPFIKGSLSNPNLSFDFRGQMGKEGLPFDPRTMQFIATGEVRQLSLVEGTSMESITLYVQVDGSKNEIEAVAEGEGLESTFRIRDFIRPDNSIQMDESTIHFVANLKEFPLEVISPFISDTLDLTEFLGDQITMNAQGNYTPQSEPRITLDLQAESPGFATTLAITLDGTLAVKENKVSSFYWEITPERYVALIRYLNLDPKAEPTYLLTQTTPLKLNISQFTCPTTTPKDLSHFLCESGFVGNLSLGKTTFRNVQTGESIVFDGISGTVEGENFSEGINVKMSGNIQAPNIPKNEKSAFSFEGQMLNFWTKTGKFNREGLTLKGMLSLDLLPVRQITGLVPLDQETREVVQAVLGELVNARIYGEISQMTGPLTIDIKATNFKTKLAMQLQKNVLVLREAVDAEITLTDEVNESLLSDINPLFLAGAYSDHPLRLHIDPQDFAIQIRPYTIQGVHIGRAVLDIGKIRVRNGGQVLRLVDFLKVKEIAPDGTMEAWFTPIYFSLKDGVASYNRFDALLAGKIHIAMWGNINLVNDRVAMTLAISAPTIGDRFGLKGLNPNEMFQVKMYGTTKKLDLDWSSAAGRIKLLVAKSIGGGIGEILGGIVESLSPKLSEEPSPPPTTSPFPWQR